MSFWKTFGFQAVSAIDTLLDSGEFTLEQLLDEEEILQETKSQNKKLLDFLIEPATLKKLVEYITVEAAEDADPKRKFKYPFLACEILGSEVWTICHAMYQHQNLLDELYAYFEKDPPLHPMLSSYTSRVATVLLQKKVPETVAYLKTKKDIISNFLKHLGNASIMDLLLKVIACEETSDGVGILEWLCTTELIPSLVAKFDPKLGYGVHENASQALSDIISVSSSANSPLIAQLESEPIIKGLFDNMLSAGLSSSSEFGLIVVIELIRRHSNEQTDDLTKLEDLPQLLKIVLEYLEKLLSLLQQQEDEAKKGTNLDLPLPIGTIPKLGFARLKIVELFTSLVHTNYLCITQHLMEKNFVASCVKVFFDHPWNNFLHSTVETMIQIILDTDNEPLKIALVKDCKLIDLICEASKASEQDCLKPKGVRRGYMGHITSITLTLVGVAQNTPSIEQYLSGHEEWNKYFKGAFKATRDKETKTSSYLPPGRVTSRQSKTLNNFDDDDDDQNSNTNEHFSKLTNDFAEDFTNDDVEELEDDFDNGEILNDESTNSYQYREEYTTGDQEFRLEDDEDEDDEDEDEGVVVEGTLEENSNEVWEEREIRDSSEEKDEFETVEVNTKESSSEGTEEKKPEAQPQETQGETPSKAEEPKVEKTEEKKEEKVEEQKSEEPKAEEPKKEEPNHTEQKVEN